MTTIVKNGIFRTPTGFKVKATSYAELEKSASSLWELLPKTRGEKYMLDCLSIFEGVFPKIGYDYCTFSATEVEECAGLTIIGPDSKIVALREDIYDKLHEGNPFGRSTVVHELSHVVLNHAVTLHRDATLGEHKFYEDSEWQAKALTAAVMMPLEACKVARSPAQLAAMCGTSVQSATYRIDMLVKKLKLLNKNHTLWDFE